MVIYIFCGKVVWAIASLLLSAQLHISIANIIIKAFVSVFILLVFFEFFYQVQNKQESAKGFVTILRIVVPQSPKLLFNAFNIRCRNAEYTFFYLFLADIGKK